MLGQGAVALIGSRARRREAACLSVSGLGTIALRCLITMLLFIYYGLDISCCQRGKKRNEFTHCHTHEKIMKGVIARLDGDMQSIYFFLELFPVDVPAKDVVNITFKWTDCYAFTHRRCDISCNQMLFEYAVK